MRRGTKRVAVCGGALSVILVVSAAAIYFGGAYHAWQDGRYLDDACGGVLDQQNVRGALGSERAQKSGTKESGAAGSLAHCRVSGNSFLNLEVDIRWVNKGGGAKFSTFMQPPNSSGSFAVPMRNRWNGALFATSENHSFATVLMPCANGSRDLVISSELTRSTEDDFYVPLARFTTNTAKKAGEKFDCNAKSGNRIEGMPRDPVKQAKSWDRVTGTCNALTDMSADFEKLQLSNAHEAPQDRSAIVEDCVLARPGDRYPAYRFTSYYGPYAETARRLNPSMEAMKGSAGQVSSLSRAWASAKCADGEAFYTVSGLSTPFSDKVNVEHPDHGLEREALSAFAEGSAKLHDCEDVAVP